MNINCCLNVNSTRRFTTKEEIDFTLELLRDRVEILREMSPLWEMAMEGIDVSEIDWTNSSKVK